MGERPEKACAEPFVLCQDLGFFLLLPHAFVIKGHRAFMDDGEQDGVFKIGEGTAVHVYGDHPEPVGP